MGCFHLEGIDFEWSDDKARVNEEKHGIAFSEAAEAFFDPFIRFDDATRDSETRQAVIGLTTNWRLLHVVFVEHPDRIRLISARGATTQERQQYEN